MKSKEYKIIFYDDAMSIIIRDDKDASIFDYFNFITIYEIIDLYNKIHGESYEC